jgi:flavin-dependent dehydrogenase
MLIDRRKLDPLLRQSAINAGATLLSSARVISRGEDFWVVATKNGDPIECHFLVNAAGRHSPLREGRAVHSPRTIALTAWVDGACLDDGESRVEAAAEAWLWAVRCGNANASVTVFVSLETAHRWQREDRKAEFLRCLRKTSLGASQTPLRLSSNIRAGDGTIAAQPCVFSNYLAHIGDAALALDPLASQGIHHALLSAQQAGIALNTTLVRGHAALAETFLSKRHDEALQQHLSACVALYRRQDTFHTPFWEERSKTIIRAPSALPAELPHGGGALFETSFVLCRNACWETLPVAVGDFIETRPALCHPRLPRAVAYLEDRPLSDLLADLPPRFTAATLLKRWIEKGLPTGAASRALVFLVRHQVLVARKRVPG